MGSLEEQRSKSRVHKPLGIRLVEYIKNQVLVLTRAMYHATRKTTSIVKRALDPESVKLKKFGSSRCPKNQLFIRGDQRNLTRGLRNGWAPFDVTDGSALLGDIDLAFLAFYLAGMYCAGQLGDRLDLQVFLTVGMLGTDLFTSLFGLGYWLNVHTFSYYLVSQMCAGLFQSTGWPSVVAVVGNWFGKSKRGLIMGIWNAHTSVGNISGTLIASAMLQYGWDWSFVVLDLLIAVVGLVVFLFLPVSPEAMGAVTEDERNSPRKISDGLADPLIASGLGSDVVKEKAVGFIAAWKIPGVAPFALCLFFSKLAAYTFLYWLPFYISCTAIDGKYLYDHDATTGDLSTMFDIGGVKEGILAGHISNRLNARAITVAGFIYCAIPALFLYRAYGHISLWVNIVLMVITGIFVNGPYALITTAVSADLGTHISLNGNSRALATVTTIIDGTGSVGAALGPSLTGNISAKSWNGVFIMLMVVVFIAGVLLTKLVISEFAATIRASRSGSRSIETRR